MRPYESFSFLKNLHVVVETMSFLNKCSLGLQRNVKWPVTNLRLYLNSLLYGFNLISEDLT